MQLYDESESSSESERGWNFSSRNRSGGGVRGASGQRDGDSSDESSSSSGMPELFSNDAYNDSSNSDSDSSSEEDDGQIPELSNRYSGSDSDSSLPELSMRRGGSSSSSSSSSSSEDEASGYARRMERQQVSDDVQVSSGSDSDSSMPELLIRRDRSTSSSSSEDEKADHVAYQFDPQQSSTIKKTMSPNKDSQIGNQMTKKDKLKMKKAKQRKLKQAKAQASTKIQALFRGSLVRIRLKCANYGFTILQALVRGFYVRKIHLDKILHLQKYRQFLNTWLKCIQLLDHISDSGLSNWATIRDKQSYIKRQELIEMDEMKETDERMDKAVEEALRSDFDSACTVIHGGERNRFIGRTKKKI